MSDELAEHLDALRRDECYRIDFVLKKSLYETTERVYFCGSNGAELGPFVRKHIDRETGLGVAYESIFAAQRAGQRFLYIPRLYDCYTLGGNLVVVMEYVGGETLQEVVRRCSPSLELAGDVFPRLCDAVDELHNGLDTPLIHRDLKPSNVMLSQDSLTVIDFGIARVFKESADEDTRHFGTRAYAPPEQFGFGQTDARTDVYTLGMLLYFCLTENIPDAKGRRKGFRNPDIPETLRRVIMQATAFDPQDRFENVIALKQAFLKASECRYVPGEVQAFRAGSMPVKGRELSGLGSVVAAQMPMGSTVHPPYDLVSSQGSLEGGAAVPLRGKKESFFKRTPFCLGVVWDLFCYCSFLRFVGALWKTR